MTEECTAQKAYEHIVGFLRTREKLPWKTAAYLKRKLSCDLKCRMETGEIEALLHARMGEGLVRYSQFPGRQSLDLLWGHRDRVGALEDLWNPNLDAKALLEKVGEFEPAKVPADAPWVFLSHSFQDISVVRNLRRTLLGRGWGVWLAETHILDGEPIIREVSKGLESADQFAMFASRRSLTSRWVLKEGGVAIKRWKKPAVLIVDGTDRDLVGAVRAAALAGWTWETLNGIAALATDDPIDKVAPTAIEELMISIFGVPETRPSVVLFLQDPTERPEPEDPPWWKPLDEAFPSLIC